MTDLKAKILSAVKGDLEDIETALQDNLNPYLDLVSQTAGHLLFSGGKRLRPLLIVLSARLCGYAGSYDKTFSTAFEYLHAATLLHDDLVDGAELRRGNPTAHSLFGNSTAVLVGDFLLARALSIAAGTGRLEVIHVVADITEKMSQGEVHQLMKKGDLTLTEEEYMEVIKAKTAVLFQGACRVSAIIADASEAEKEALSDYGYHLGIAFQMADDLFDYTRNTAELGKEIGADLKEGKLTLPVISALKVANTRDREEMSNIILNEDFTKAEFDFLVELLNKYNGVSYTEDSARQNIQKAKEALSVFAPSHTRELLIDIAEYALFRKS